MASRIYPLKSSVRFKEVFERGKKLRASSWLTVYFLETNDGRSEFGLTLSRKVASSVLRNKLKRWVRASAQSKDWPKSFSGKTVVFVFRPQADERFFKKLEFKSFKATLAKLD